MNPWDWVPGAGRGMVQAGGLRAVVLRRCRDTPGLVRDVQLVMVWVGARAPERDGRCGC